MLVGEHSPLMRFRRMIRDIQDLSVGIRSFSRRSFDLRLPYLYGSHSHTLVPEEEAVEQGDWADMPPELLTEIVKRLECSESSWPSRRNVVACAGVCSSWRKITKELVQSPALSGKLTFPISLKQAGRRDASVQCFIKRDQATSTYSLFLGLSPNLANRKFLLSARKFRCPTISEYVISLDPENFSRSGNSYMGKLRSNFLGTKFTLYDNRPSPDGTVASAPVTKTGRQVTSKDFDAGNYAVAHVGYELNVLGARGPRRMQCTLLSIPASAMKALGSLPTTVEFSDNDHMMPVLPHPKSKYAGAECSNVDREQVITCSNKDQPLILRSKVPRWHEQLQCWCLNFRGRVTVASVKNFQLVAAREAMQSVIPSDCDKVLLQFGKIGKDLYTMDYCYPLSAFQAFAICLSSFDTKLACE